MSYDPIEDAQAKKYESDLDECIKRITTLESENADLRHDIERATQRNSDLLAEAEALRVDAERYRWLRDNRFIPFVSHDHIHELNNKAGVVLHRISVTYSDPIAWAETKDACIDAARNQGGSNER